MAEDNVLLPVNNFEKYEHETRLGFIRKVMGIVCFQLLITVILVLYVYLSEDFKDFLYENS